MTSATTRTSIRSSGPSLTSTSCSVRARAGMKLVMDLVVDHTSDEHPWFGVAPGAPQPQARLVHVARPAARRPTGARPSPARPGSDPATGEYYLHLFSRKQPDLNWENPEVRDGLRDDALVARPRVDGFRMDVINYISKDPAARRPLAPGLGDCTP